MQWLVNILVPVFWCVLGVLLIETIRGKSNLWSVVVLMGVLGYQLWFYAPRGELVPSVFYGPVEQVHLWVDTSVNIKPTVEESGEIMALANEMTGSRRYGKTLAKSWRPSDVWVAVYFSKLGEDWSHNVFFVTPSGGILVKDEQVYVMEGDATLFEYLHEIKGTL